MFYVFLLLLSSAAAITLTQFESPYIQQIGVDAIRVKYVPSSTGTPVIYGVAGLRPTNNISVSYDLFFEPGFSWQKGGKLPGLKGGDPKIKSSGCVPVDYRVFSLRPMWRQNGRLMMYMYSQNRSSSDACGIGPSSPDWTLPIGRWFRLTIQMKLNSQAAASDGFGRLLVDNKKILEVTNISWHRSTSMINSFLFSTFYGGHDQSWSPPNVTYSRMRNLSVGYIFL